MAAIQAKPTKEKKAAAPSPHPPYLEMIKEAISALKDRTGSSQPAIAKFLEDRYKTHLPANFRKMLSTQLRRFAKSEKLFKVKNSYKLSAPDKKAPTAGAASAPAAHKGPGRPPKKSVEAAKAKKKVAPTKPKVAKKAVDAKPKVASKAVADKKKKPAVKKAAVLKKKPLKAVKSPVGKKRTVKSIKSPKKGPVAKKAKISK